ncbi:Putative GroES-like superfamily, alcohol dehydrogenase-like, NAD(P)-binding domain superfamily [Septoria linicola]|uniref:GroES-like superfamily, alcohol dehydrogenase-like, NAD(P)-binding domain superfamily n=1 Tax=Septoria linicola TaxID=215465 RepID=A0A9Q9ATL0_9PEZI|nr:Putative GroES-like superfamily, alcohol dehydrogenase-like, NAD(P)-binding domain superfamily [Septoria linicola]
MPTQTALIVSEVGGRVHPVSNWPIPQPEQGQIQIRVSIAGLNPHDQKARDTGLFIKDSLPTILAHDLTAKISDTVNEHEAAALPTNVIASSIAIFDPSGLGIPAPWSPEAASFGYADASLLIVGGGTNCGRFGVQLAKLAGIGEIVVIGGDEKELMEWGATHVLNRHAGDAKIVEQIRSIVGDELLYAFDTINLPEDQHIAISALSSSRKGTVARLRASIGKVDETKIIGQKTVPKTAKPFWDRVAGYLQTGALVSPRYKIVKGLDADKVNAVLDRYRDGEKVIQTHFEVEGVE